MCRGPWPHTFDILYIFRNLFVFYWMVPGPCVLYIRQWVGGERFIQSLCVEVVIREARLQGLFLLPVPAGLTPLLQPLDLWCFAPYKRLLEDESRKQRMDQGGEPLSVETWFRCIFQVCTAFWAGRSFWKAFAQAGLPTCDRTHPLHRDLRVLFPNGRPDVEEQCLSQEEFRQLLPRNYNLHRTFDDFMGGPRGEVPQLL